MDMRPCSAGEEMGIGGLSKDMEVMLGDWWGGGMQLGWDLYTSTVDFYYITYFSPQVQKKTIYKNS